MEKGTREGANITVRYYKILFGILIINVLSYFIGVLPPAGRAYYLPKLICEITILMLTYFAFAVPLLCVGGIIFSVFRVVKEHLAHKCYLIFAAMFLAELIYWHDVFRMLMSV